MRTSIRFSLLTLFAGLALLVGACSSTGPAPEGLAFQDESSGDQPGQDDGLRLQDDQSSGSSTTAPSTTEAPTTTVPRVNRPTNRTCSTNDHSIAFPASTTLLDPAAAVAGPFSIAVPAGTYDITVSSWLGFEEDPAQTQEQWYFTTDSGYTSPLSTDSSPELIWSDVFSSQTIGADTTSITLFHKSPGTGIDNSVHPLCIGFRAVAAPETTTTTTTTEAPTTTTEAQVEAPATTAAPTTTTTAAAVNDTAPAELALTGVSDLSLSLGLTGAALTLAGSAALIAARRKED